MPVLEGGPDAAAPEDVPPSWPELEVTALAVRGCVEPEDVTLLLTLACRTRLFSSLTILSLSSLHCLSLACLSFS